MKNIGLMSAIIYTGLSIVVAALFLVATLPGNYTAVERIGGAGWVFLLSMIILMPVVIQQVKKRFGKNNEG